MNQHWIFYIKHKTKLKGHVRKLELWVKFKFQLFEQVLQLFPP